MTIFVILTFRRAFFSSLNDKQITISWRQK